MGSATVGVVDSVSESFLDEESRRLALFARDRCAGRCGGCLNRNKVKLGPAHALP